MTDPKKVTETIFAALEENETIGAAIGEIADGDVDEVAKLIGGIRTIVASALATAAGGADNLAWLQDKLRESDSNTELTLGYDHDAKKFLICAAGARFCGDSLPETIAAMRW
jgi:hypothetical protein